MREKNCSESNIGPLIERIRAEKGHNYKYLFIIFGILGDFDSFEYAQSIVNSYRLIEQSRIKLQIIGIGDSLSKEKFCDFTKLPRELITVVNNNNIHTQLGLYKGLSLPIDPWLNLLLMCSGFRSPGTLKEVFRGYLGDKEANQIFPSDHSIDLKFIPSFNGAVFKQAGGVGFQRPFELATLRLLNMIEILSNIDLYFKNKTYLTQRGGTFLLDSQGNILFEYRPTSLLSYSQNMSKPLNFLRSHS